MDEPEFAAYERSVLDLFRRSLEPLAEVHVEHQGVVEGRGGAYRIDTLVRFSAFGVAFVVLVEAKRESRPVDRATVLELEGKVRAVGAHKGVLVSWSGFQSGAEQLARDVGIALLRLRDHHVETVVRHAILAPAHSTPVVLVHEITRDGRDELLTGHPSRVRRLLGVPDQPPGPDR